MGDRSNVFFQMDERDGKWQGIGIYSHWRGEGLFPVALRAATASIERLGDTSYFVRRAVQLTLNEVADPDDPTGYGLWTGGPDDNEHHILVINAETGNHWFCDENNIHEPAPIGCDNLRP